MITGAHAIIYSKNAEADKAFFRDVLKMPNVDVGRGWLIFGLPPSELAAHPTDGKTSQEIYLMVDDINRFVDEMEKLKITCTTIQDEGWGRLTELILPGGGGLGVYEPRHARPKPMKPQSLKAKSPLKPKISSPSKRSETKSSKKPSSKTASKK